MALKIDRSPERKPQSLTSRIDRDYKKVNDKSETHFSSHMDHQFSESQDEELKKKALEIEKQGKRLASHIDVSELKAYKKLVMEFLNEVVSEVHRFSRTVF